MGILKDKTALIIAGAQGIGRGIAIEMAKAGANIIIAQRQLEKAESTLAELDSLGVKSVAVPMDVTDQNKIKYGVEQALEYFPQIDILVNNAGVLQSRLSSDTAIEDFDLCYEVNTKSLWTVSQAVIPIFKRQGEGKIINIASTGGRGGSAGIPAYAASKAATINLTQSLAMALGPHNINVNALCPGVVQTAMWERMEEMIEQSGAAEQNEARTAYDDMAASVPLKRNSTPEDIGQAAVFLSSSLARNITGQSLNIDGGLVMN